MNIKRYTASLPLQSEFLTNPDGCGDTVFTQLKRNGNVCLYQRVKAQIGRLATYEVFITKTVKAGAPLPGGGFIEKDYEQYPGKSGFGVSAWSHSTLESATNKFNELVKAQSVKDEPKIEESNDIPNGEFTAVEFATFNCLPSYKGYPAVRELIEKGLVKESRREKRGVGKPTVIYCKA